MNKTIFCILIISLICSSLKAQTPSFYLKWDKRYGGDMEDAIGAIQKTADGGFILGGTSNSGISGDKTEPNHDPSMFSSDFWLIKIDSTGLKQWDKRLGGTNSDILYNVIQTSDGGYLAGGQTYSGVGGDKSQPNWDPTQQSNDYWIIKTDAQGNKVWDKRFGGTSFELFTDVKQTPDGGYILGGTSFSGIGGDKTELNKGSWDFWVIKTDANGNKIWDRSVGGLDDDFATAVDLTDDGGYLIGGYSKSNIGGDKSQFSQGNWDYWVIKLDSVGDKVWDKTFGGAHTDWLFDLIRTNDGGFLLGGQSFSGATGDKSEPNWDPDPSGSDRWIVKIDNMGNKLWDRTYGGIEVDDLRRIVQTSDNGFLLSGESYSPISGNKTEANLGTEQTWVIKTDSMGLFEWDKTIFSLGHDESGSAIPFNDLCFVTVNYCLVDTGGYKSEFSWGLGDFWMTMICQDDPSSTGPLTDDLAGWAIYPNPVSDVFTLKQLEYSKGDLTVEIFDLKGKKLLHQQHTLYQSNRVNIDVNNLTDGVYYCRITTREKSSVLKFVIHH